MLIFIILKSIFFQQKVISIMAFMLSQQNNHYFQMSSNGTDSLLTFIIAFLMSKEFKRSSVIGSVAFKCGAFTQLTFWRIVMFIKWHILLWIFIEVFLRRKRLGCGKMFVITVISVVLLEELATLLSITLLVCVFVCVCVCVCVCLCVCAEDVFSLLSMCPWLCKCSSVLLV